MSRLNPTITYITSCRYLFVVSHIELVQIALLENGATVNLNKCFDITTRSTIEDSKIRWNLASYGHFMTRFIL